MAVYRTLIRVFFSALTLAFSHDVLLAADAAAVREEGDDDGETTGAPRISGPAAVAGEVNRKLKVEFQIEGDRPVTLRASGLPAGLELRDNKIEGTPRTACVSDVKLKAQNAKGSVEATLTISISGEALEITSRLEVTAKVGQNFSYSLKAKGAKPIAFEVTDLPPGLFFSGSTIAGTPFKAGHFSIQLKATDGAGAVAAETLALSVVEKNENAPPKTGELEIVPLPATAGETVRFNLPAFDPDEDDVTVTWNFGDGTTADGAEVSHVYAAPGTYAVEVSVSDGQRTQTVFEDVDVLPANAGEPRIRSVTATDNPSRANVAVEFKAEVTDPDSDTVEIEWNFGDGSPAAKGAIVSHTYANAGDYVATVMATDAGGNAARARTVDIFITDGTGPGTVVDGSKSENPLNGVSICVADSKRGAVKLAIDLKALIREAFTATTVFGDGGAAETGLLCAHRFTSPGIFIATTDVQESASGALRGRARKTLPISREEIGAGVAYTVAPMNRAIEIKSLKGKFIFMARGADRVALLAQIELPAGLDLSQPQEMWLSMGNVVDRMVLGPGGASAANGAFTKMKVRWPRLGKQRITVAGQKARIQATMLMADMDRAGFDTEGVTREASQAPMAIQCAMMLAGTTYSVDAPVQYRVSGSHDTGMLMSRGQ